MLQEKTIAMQRRLLLMLLYLWVAEAEACETGVAFVNSILSVPRSLMANADVALLKSYDVLALNQCLEECCSAKYGACSVASFKKNSSDENCLHFNCRPLHKCKFLSSNSTDSFTFSSNPVSLAPPPTAGAGVPHESPEQSHAKNLDSENQFAFKNGNTSVKPRKGVNVLTPDDLMAKSGVKPRKGVSIEDVPHSKLLPSSLNRSNVKARKGVGLYSTTPHEPPSSASSLSEVAPLTSTNASMSINVTEDDVMYDLGKVFEDDTRVVSENTTPEPQTFSTATTHSAMSHVSTGQPTRLTPSTAHTILYSSNPSSGSNVETSWSQTPPFQSFPSVPTFAPTAVEEHVIPLHSSSSAILSATASTGVLRLDATTYERHPPEKEAPVADYTRDDEATDEEAEKATVERRYQSSMHLVLSLVFGLLVLFAVLGVVAKRVYDGWVRRDYYRMNYLIDGIYDGNGVD